MSKLVKREDLRLKSVKLSCLHCLAHFMIIRFEINFYNTLKHIH